MLRPPFRSLPKLCAPLFCTMLSSCMVYWNTGARLKDNAVTYTCLDLHHPVDDVVYEAPDKRFYMHAPEITYKVRHNLCGVEDYTGGHGTHRSDTEKVDVITTGRAHWVCLGGCANKEDGESPGTLPHGEGAAAQGSPCVVDALPAGSKPIPFRPGDRTAWTLHSGSAALSDTRREPDAWLYTAAAVPLELLVDPVLMLGSTAALYASWAPIVPIGLVGTAVMHCSRSAGAQTQGPETGGGE